MALTAVSPAHALRPPRRLDVRAILGIALMIVATGGSLAFWNAESTTRTVLLATRDLPAGATLRATDITLTRVHAEDAVYRVAIPGEELMAQLGKQLAEPVHAGQLLARAQLSPRPPLASGRVAMTISVGPQTAIGGQLRPGDAVRVLVTTAKGRPDSAAKVVLERALVYAVHTVERTGALGAGGAAEGSARGGAPGPVSALTLVVTQEQALVLAHARWNGELDVVLLPAEHP